MSEEAEILREMIADRDRQLEVMEHKTEAQFQKEQRLLDDLDKATEKNAKQHLAYDTDTMRMQFNQQVVLEQLEHIQMDLRRQGSTLTTFANMKVSSADLTEDSQYVMRMQAQLCKAMHSMGILDHQLNLMTQHTEANAKAQHHALTTQREAKSQLELTLLNELIATDTDARAMEQELKTKLEGIKKECKILKRQLKKGAADDDDDDDEDMEDDEETKKAKEEIVKSLDQRKEEIKKIEAELDAQEEEIAELRKKLGDQAPPEEEKIERPVAKEVELDDDDDDDDEEEEAPTFDPMAERLKQVMKNASLDEVSEDVNEFDLLKLAQSRLAGNARIISEDDDDDDDDEDDDEDDDDDDEEEDEDDEDEEHDEDENAMEGEPTTEQKPIQEESGTPENVSTEVPKVAENGDAPAKSSRLSDELDLLKLAQSRLAGGGATADDEDDEDDDDEEDDEDDDEEEEEDDDEDEQPNESLAENELQEDKKLPDPSDAVQNGDHKEMEAANPAEETETAPDS